MTTAPFGDNDRTCRFSNYARNDGREEEVSPTIAVAPPLGADWDCSSATNQAKPCFRQAR